MEPRKTSLRRNLPWEWAVSALIVLAASGVWFRQGASRRFWTQDRRLVEQVDPITGIAFGEWDESVWIPGLGFLLTALLVAIGLCGLGFVLRTNPKGQDESEGVSRRESFEILESHSRDSVLGPPPDLAHVHRDRFLKLIHSETSSF